VIKEKGQRVRQHIIDAANRLFYERGFNQTSFSDIAGQAGIPRGNFYYHFKSKDEILLAVIDDRLTAIRAMLDEWSDTIPEPRDRLRRYAEIPLNDARDVVRYGCPMGTLNMELVKGLPVLQHKAGEMFDVFLEWLEQQFVALDKGDEARMLALQLLGEMQGAALITSVYKDGDYLIREMQRLKGWLDTL
jgi:AcrR family transcriptional regulator